ncbi:MAG TPA: hypothetical protein VF172_01365 [Nitrososphaera sp.]|jgi:hypothetical protein
MTFPAADRKSDEIEGAEILSATGWKRALGCRYAQLCRHCHADSRTCKDDTEASTYCGAYDLFANFRPSKMNTISQ